MSKPAIQRPPLSIESYLGLEESSPEKHEYVAGVIFALAGASKRHNRIAGNIFARLRQTAGGSDCRVYMSDVKLRVPDDAFYYPDVMVACGPDDLDAHVEEAPCLVVEVCSPATETIDRREKALAYRRLASLRAYLIVDQERRRVERHFRESDGRWWHAVVADDGVVPVPCPEAALTLDEIYEGVRIP